MSDFQYDTVEKHIEHVSVRWLIGFWFGIVVFLAGFVTAIGPLTTRFVG